MKISGKIITIESSATGLFLFVFFILKIFSAELLINIVFALFICMLFLFRSANIRHMYYGFISLLLSLTGNMLGFDNFVYISSSLALSFFILGSINMILFRE